MNITLYTFTALDPEGDGRGRAPVDLRAETSVCLGGHDACEPRMGALIVSPELSQPPTSANSRAYCFAKVSQWTPLALSLHEALPRTEAIRFLRFEVKPECTKSFQEKKRSIWEPILSTTQGMVWGFHGLDPADPNHFLTLTLWQNLMYLRGFEERVLGAIWEQVEAEADIKRCTGMMIPLEASWSRRDDGAQVS